MTSTDTEYPVLPLIKIVKTGNYTYLWTYSTQIKNGRKYDIKGRSSVGKLQHGGNTGLVIWKEEFLEQHPELRAFNVHRVATKTGTHAKSTVYKFIFTPKEGNASENSSQIDMLYNAGATWSFDQLLKDTNLVIALNRTFASNDVQIRLLSLAYFFILTQSCEYEHYVRLISHTRMPFPNVETSSALKQLLSHLSSSDRAHFFSTLQDVTKAQQKADTNYWILDCAYPHDIYHAVTQEGRILEDNKGRALASTLTRYPHIKFGRTAAFKRNLSRALSRTPDRVLTIINPATGQSHAYTSYNSAHYLRPELTDFIKYHVFFKDKGHENGASLELSQGMLKHKPTEKTLLRHNIKIPLTAQSMRSAAFEHEIKAKEQGYLSMIKAPALLPGDLNITLPQPDPHLTAQQQAILITNKKDHVFRDLLQYLQSKTLFVQELPLEHSLMTKSQQHYLKKLFQNSNYHKVDREFLFRTTKLIHYSNQYDDDGIFNENRLQRTRMKTSVHLIMRFDMEALFQQCFAQEVSLAIQAINKGEECDAIIRSTARSKAKLLSQIDSAADHEEILNLHRQLGSSKYGAYSPIDDHTLPFTIHSDKFNESAKGKVFFSREKIVTIQRIEEYLAQDYMSEDQKNFVEEHLMQFAKDKNMAKNLLSVWVTNSELNAVEIKQAYDLLMTQEHFFDLLSTAVLDSELQSAQMGMGFKQLLSPPLPELEGKEFVLYLASAVSFLFKTSFYNFKNKYADKLPLEVQRLTPDQLLQALNKVTALRRSAGMFYSDLKVNRQNLFNFINVPVPTFEGFSNGTGETEVKLRRTN